MRIDEMPAGHEMDALITEKVMGFTLYIGDEIPDGHEHQCLQPGEVPEIWLKERIDHGGFYRYCKHCGNMPEYSTDIADAWRVVEKMGNYLFACGRNDNGMWEACFFSVNSGIGKLSEGHGDTAPLVICRAGLKALGVVGI